VGDEKGMSLIFMGEKKVDADDVGMMQNEIRKATLAVCIYM